MYYEMINIVSIFNCVIMERVHSNSGSVVVNAREKSAKKTKTINLKKVIY